MPGFISIIKQIPTESLIYKLSELSIEMFHENITIKEMEKTNTFNSLPSKIKTSLLLWDIPSIDYLSVCNSNDYRHISHIISIDEIVSRYRIYENEHSVSKDIEEANYAGIMRILTGMSAEQFMLDNMRWVFQSFNRNYYILMILQKKLIHPVIDVDKIVFELFGVSADDYTNLIMIIMWLCMQHPDPLSAAESIYKKSESTFLTKESIKKVIQHYSCDYETIRSHCLKKQLFYTKPFIHTDRNDLYIASCVHLILMILGNGLYWVLRDYYYRNKSQYFVNTFGTLYELYIEDISNRNCTHGEFCKLKISQKKSADYLYEFDHIRILVEAKSGLLGVEGKQQVPLIPPIDSFIERNIKEAYEQLCSSYKRIILDKCDDKPTIKVILLFDIFSNASIIEHASDGIFQADTKCFIMTIREFEILLMIYQCSKDDFNNAVHMLISPNTSCQNHYSITYVFDKLNLWKYDFFQGDYDYFHILLRRLGKEMKGIA